MNNKNVITNLRPATKDYDQIMIIHKAKSYLEIITPNHVLITFLYKTRMSEPFCDISHFTLMVRQLVMAVDRLPLHFPLFSSSRRKLPNHFIEWLLRKVSESPPEYRPCSLSLSPPCAHTRALFHPRCHNRLLFFGDRIQRGLGSFSKEEETVLAALEI